MEKGEIYEEDHIFSVDEVKGAIKHKALLTLFFVDGKSQYTPLDKIDANVLSTVANLDYDDFTTCLGEDLPKEIVLYFIEHFTETGEFDKLGACCFDVADSFEDEKDFKSQKHYVSKINSKMKEKEYLYALGFFVDNGDESEIKWVKDELSKMDISKFTDIHKIENIIQQVANKGYDQQILEKFDNKKLLLSQSYIKALLEILK